MTEASFNRQHWVLDVQFGEDDNRTRKDHSPENPALIRRTALNLFSNSGSGKDSLRRRKRRTCMSDRYRAELIFGKMKQSAIALLLVEMLERFVIASQNCRESIQLK